MLNNFIRNRVQRELDAAKNPKGMSLHTGKVTLEICDVERMLLSAAPTPPAPVPKSMPLETLIEELATDYEMKALMDEARKTVLLDGCTVTDLPTPPEVNHFYGWGIVDRDGDGATYIVPESEKDADERCKNFNAGHNEGKYRVVRLFYRDDTPSPADDELRKAVKKYIKTCETGSFDERVRDMQKMVAALNKGKS